MLTLNAYLLGTVPVPDVVALQRRLAYDVGGADATGAVVLCEHPPGVTVGRHGSRAEVRLSDDDLRARRWPVRFVPDGGGAVLHLPGQVVCYPVLPLAPFALTPAGYVAELLHLLAGVVGSFGVAPTVDPLGPTLRLAGRRVAHLGVSVRNGVTAGGVVLNVSPDLAALHPVRPAHDPKPMTSLQRECRERVRLPAVRQRLLEALEARFAARLNVFHHHPSLNPRPSRHASLARRRETA